MAYWLQQAKTNIICPSLVILPPSVTHSTHKWPSPALFFSICSLLTVLFSPTQATNTLTSLLNLSPLGFHWITSLPSASQRPCWDLPVSLSCVRASWLLNSATGRTVTLFVRAGYTLSTPFPIPSTDFCIFLLLFFLMLPFISFSVTVFIQLLSTMARFIRDTLSSPLALLSWSLLLLKLFKLHIKCYGIIFCPWRQRLTGVWITKGWYLAAI